MVRTDAGYKTAVCGLLLFFTHFHFLIVYFNLAIFEAQLLGVLTGATFFVTLSLFLQNYSRKWPCMQKQLMPGCLSPPTQPGYVAITHIFTAKYSDSLVPRLPHSRTRTLKLCRCGEPGIFSNVRSGKAREGVERT